MTETAMMKVAFFFIGYIYCAALFWHLVRRESLPGPWEGTGGGYPRAIFLFPYYLPWYITAFIIYGAMKYEKKTQMADDRDHDLSEEVFVALIVSIYFVAKMLGFVEADEQNGWESDTAQ